MAPRTATANEIVAGAITAAKLSVADVQAAVVTAAKINALTLNAVSITGGSISGVSISGQTITGGTVRTAASGKRIELNAGWYDTLRGHTGNAGETGAGYLRPADGSTKLYLTIGAPQISGGLASYIDPVSDQAAPYSLCRVSAARTSILGQLLVSGAVRPANNRSSGVSDDGLWKRDANVVARRYKLYYDSSNCRLYVRYGSGGSEYSYFARAGGSG